MFGGQSDYYYSERKEYGSGYPPTDYPPMPPYGQYGHGGDPYQYNSSVATLPDEQHYDDNDYGSTAHLALSAAPMAAAEDRTTMSSPQPTYPNQQQGYQNGYASDPHAAYRGPSPGVGVAYGQAYGDPHQQQASYNGYARTEQRGGDTYDYNAGQAHAM